MTTKVTFSGVLVKENKRWNFQISFQFLVLEKGRVHKPKHVSFLVHQVSFLVLFVVASEGVPPQILGEDSPA